MTQVTLFTAQTNLIVISNSFEQQNQIVVKSYSNFLKMLYSPKMNVPYTIKVWFINVDAIFQMQSVYCFPESFQKAFTQLNMLVLNSC